MQEQMLYSQSMEAGLLMEMDRDWKQEEMTIRTEGVFPEYKKEYLIVPEKEMQQKVREENLRREEENKTVRCKIEVLILCRITTHKALHSFFEVVE